MLRVRFVSVPQRCAVKRWWRRRRKLTASRGILSASDSCKVGDSISSPTGNGSRYPRAPPLQLSNAADTRSAAADAELSSSSAPTPAAESAPPPTHDPPPLAPPPADEFRDVRKDMAIRTRPTARLKRRWSDDDDDDIVRSNAKTIKYISYFDNVTNRLFSGLHEHICWPVRYRYIVKGCENKSIFSTYSECLLSIAQLYNMYII